MDEINLVGKRVTAIRLLTDKELEAEGWEVDFDDDKPVDDGWDNEDQDTDREEPEDD